MRVQAWSAAAFERRADEHWKGAQAFPPNPSTDKGAKAYKSIHTNKSLSESPHANIFKTSVSKWDLNIFSMG